mmetsp:Transcript_76410/g.168813  ORF Transcript_76410/g.168813 Transcript_76410/m.168813 type:complete len:254 (-) Transcript_76410:914-1675(-)
MGQDVRVANQDLVIWEGPVALGAAGVVVVDEGHSVLRQPADESRRLALAVPQTPELRQTTGLLEDALRGEIEGRGLLSGGVDPVHQLLTMLVLVIAESVAVVVHVRPQLSHCPGGVALAAILSHKLRTVTLHEIKAPSIETHLQTQPAQPDAYGFLHLGVAMINVRCSIEATVQVPRAVHSTAVRILIAQGHGPATPVRHAGEAGPVLHPTGELVPAPLGVLTIPTPVIDDDVGEASDAVLVTLFQQIFQSLL